MLVFKTEKEVVVIDIQARGLVRRVRKVLNDGLSIAVFGWRDSNHNNFTKGLPKEKVIFISRLTTKCRSECGACSFDSILRP